MADEVAIELHKLRQSIDKQNELQERATAVMAHMVEALHELTREISYMPEIQAAREEEKQKAQRAATGKFATPKPPRHAR